MGRRRKPASERDPSNPPPPMLNARQWSEIIHEMKFTPQQARIVALILQGKRDKQIAGLLRISESTIRTHLGHVFARLDVTDRVELVLHIWAGSGLKHG